MTKQEVSDILDEISTLLELKGENPFKCRAYANAARAVASLETDLSEAVRSGALKEVKGIGAALFEKITELVATGKLGYYEELKASVPPGLLDMIRIPGLGPKRAKAIFDQLGISTVGELEYACNENRLLTLEGFGPRMQEKILQGIQYVRKQKGQFHYPVAANEAERLYDALKTHKTVQRIAIAGSLRRKKEVVKDIDLLVSAERSGPVTEAFTTLPEVEEVIAKGETKSSVRLKSGINADLRVVSDAEFPYALHHFTGSKEHNVAMRGRALRLGFKMNEYGLFQGEKLIACKNEEEIFARLGLAFIPPELREDMGEIAAAETKKLPKLIAAADIKGIFHNHTVYSDGNATLEAMVEAARSAGYEYIGISDHSRSAVYANGLEIERVRQQQKEIDELHKKHKDITIFKGTECDILPDGTLDYPDDVLAGFDFVIASIHSKFAMTEAGMTDRILKAIQNPYVTILAHPTGRLLLTREAYPVDMRKIIRAARDHGVVMELNANPLRLDLDWRLCPLAVEMGVPVSINPDAHSVEGIGDVQYGVGIARKGWLTRESVFNTKSAVEMKKVLAQRRPAPP
ncbi:MAG: DNA polymerase/3'-5' exonuclease PolX [Nitrospirae bacterium]|nr:DNA polymerase/3'-5' exonuclease PolX [Nitrospirota bacterium]